MRWCNTHQRKDLQTDTRQQQWVVQTYYQVARRVKPEVSEGLHQLHDEESLAQRSGTVESNIAVTLFVCLVYFASGMAVGWLLSSKFLKVVLIAFMIILAQAYALYSWDIMKLNEFAISIHMQELTDVSHLLWRAPFIAAFILGAWVWRRYLTHL